MFRILPISLILLFCSLFWLGFPTLSFAASPSPSVWVDKPSLTLGLNQQETLRFTMNNTGGSAGAAYLTVSLSDELEVVSSSGWTLHQKGSLVYQVGDANGNPTKIVQDVMYEVEISDYGTGSRSYSLIVPDLKNSFMNIF